MPTREEKRRVDASSIQRSSISRGSDFNWPKWDLPFGGGQKRTAEYRVVPLKLISIRRPCPSLAERFQQRIKLGGAKLNLDLRKFPVSRIEVYSIFLFVIRKMGGARRQISLIKFVERGRILREEDGIFFFVGFIINPEIFEDHRNWN